MEKYIFNIVEEFRRQISSNYSQYAEFFHLFSDRVSYVSLALWKVNYDGVLKKYELRIYETKYRDRFEERYTLDYKNTIGYPSEEAQFIDHENHEEWENSLWEDVGYDPSIDQPILERVYPEEIITLPLDFWKLDIKEFVKREIESTILKKLRDLQNNILLNKSINRLSLINQGEITKIINFLDNDWTTLDDKIKTPMFVKIFSLLGFETIPIELLLDNPKYSEFNQMAHPEVIIYDISSNFIVLIEELTKLEKKYLYKTNITKSMINKFSSFFPRSNRKISYLIIVNKPITIDLDHYNIQERVILKDDLVVKLTEVFNQKFLQNDLFHYKKRKKIKELIDFLKE